MAKSPILHVYDILNNDEILTNMLYDMRDVDEEGENMIFTFDIREEYRKRDYAPMLRVTPISTVEKVWADDDSGIYSLLFSVEIFTQTITHASDIGDYILNNYKSKHNCICVNQNIQYDDVTDLYNNFMRFKIYINK